MSEREEPEATAGGCGGRARSARGRGSSGSSLANGARPPLRELSDPQAIGAAIRAARERAGLSLRKLAATCGLSHATLGHVEAGGDVRLSSLQRIVDALPELSAVDVLVGPAPALAPPASRRAWLLHRRACRFEAATLLRRVTIRRSGDVVHRLRVEGLESDDGPMSDPEIKRRVLRAIFTGSTSALRGIDDADLRRARLEVAEEESVHVLHVPVRGARRGGSYTVRRTKAGVFAPERLAAAREAAGGPVVHGVSLAVAWPVRQAAVEVRFSADTWPGDEALIAGHCWPQCLAPELEAGNLLPLVHPGPTLRIDAERRRARLVVRHPMIEMQYGVGWESP